MKILHVITRLILGGAQQNTVLSCAAQTHAGHDVHLAFGPIHGPEGSLLEEAKASGATLHEIPSMVRELSPLNDWCCRRALMSLVRELKPDVVHSHSSKAGILARSAAWRARHPLQGDIVLDRSKRFGLDVDAITHFRNRNRPVVLHTVHGLPFHQKQNPLTHALYIALEKYAAKRCDHLIAITPAMADAFVEKRIAPRKKFTIIPSGVDLERFHLDLTPEEAKKQLGLDPTQPVVGLVARLDPLKGHHDLIAALPRLVQAPPSSTREPARPGPGAGGETPRLTKNRTLRLAERKTPLAERKTNPLAELGIDPLPERVQVLFVGDGFDRANIEQAIADSPHRDRITMLDLVPFEQMPAVYRAIDVCVLPSYQEGQSRVLVEALAAGCAIVAYDAGGIPSVCIDHDTGLLVPVGDTDALADAIVFMLKNPEKRQAMTQRGIAHVQQHFSAEKMNRELLALYNSL